MGSPYAQVPYEPNADNLTDAVEKGNGGGGLDSTVAAAQAAKDDEVTMMLKDYIKSQMIDLKAQDENANTDPLNSVFGDYNQGLFRMGLNILGKRTGNAFSNIAGGIMDSQDQEEAKKLGSIQRKNARMKDLLNVRYLDAMTNQMNPQVRAQIAAENNAAELKKAIIIEQMKIQADRENDARTLGASAFTETLKANQGMPYKEPSATWMEKMLPGFTVERDTSHLQPGLN